MNLKIIKSLFIKFALVAAATIGFSMNAQAQIPVTDIASITTTTMNQVINVAKYVQQIENQIKQIENQAKQIQSITGARDLGALINSSQFNQLLPTELKTAYDDLMKSGVMKSTSTAIALLGKIGGANCGSQTGTAKTLCEAAALATPSNLTALSDTVKQTEQRSTQLAGLIAKANSTTDAKESADLTAGMLGVIGQILTEGQAAQSGYYMRKEQQDLQLQQRANALPKSKATPSLF